jgi:hypothetical protein
METDAFKNTQHVAATIALENQHLQQREIEHKQLAAQLEANQVLHATRDIANYAKAKNIPVEDVMDNITDHIDVMEMSGKTKIEAVRMANKRVKDNDLELKRRHEIVNRINSVHFSDETLKDINRIVDGNILDKMLTDDLDSCDFFRDYATMPKERFDQISEWYLTEIARKKKS